MYVVLKVYKFSPHFTAYKCLTLSGSSLTAWTDNKIIDRISFTFSDYYACFDAMTDSVLFK